MLRDGVLSRKKLCLAAMTIVVFFALLVPCALANLGNGKLQIHHIDVGQGDGALIISPEGQIAMVDDGTNMTSSGFVAYVTGLGVTSYDYNFASHYHADHVGRLCDLLNAGVVLNVAGYDRGYSYTTQTYLNYVACLGAKRQTMAKNQVITLDAGSANPVYIKCVDLNGAGVYSVTGSDENPKSMVLKITYGCFDEVMGGDLTSLVEATVGPKVGDVEVYKVHHHGASTSTSDVWLNATTPEVAVISVSSTNSYGYVPQATFDRLCGRGIKVYMTEAGAGAIPPEGCAKVGGTIIIEADPQPGATYTVRGTGFNDTFFSSTCADTTHPQVTVVRPNGGEVFYAESQDTIRWVATDNFGVDSVSIYYSTDGGATFPHTIATGEQNDSVYVWTIPDVTSDSCVVKIVVYDGSLNTAEAIGDAFFTMSGTIGIGLAPEVVPFGSLRSHPNPFNPMTRVEFTLDTQTRVSLRIFDIYGRAVRTLVHETLPSGEHSVLWNGQDERGVPVASGVYICRLEGEGKTAACKMVLLK